MPKLPATASDLGYLLSLLSVTDLLLQIVIDVRALFTVNSITEFAMKKEDKFISWNALASCLLSCSLGQCLAKGQGIGGKCHQEDVMGLGTIENISCCIKSHLLHSGSHETGLVTR